MQRMVSKACSRKPSSSLGSESCVVRQERLDLWFSGSNTRDVFPSIQLEFKKRILPNRPLLLLTPTYHQHYHRHYRAHSFLSDFLRLTRHRILWYLSKVRLRRSWRDRKKVSLLECDFLCCQMCRLICPALFLRPFYRLKKNLWIVGQLTQHRLPPLDTFISNFLCFPLKSRIVFQNAFCCLSPLRVCLFVWNVARSLEEEAMTIQFESRIKVDNVVIKLFRQPLSQRL